MKHPQNCYNQCSHAPIDLSVTGHKGANKKCGAATPDLFICDTLVWYTERCGCCLYHRRQP